MTLLLTSATRDELRQFLDETNDRMNRIFNELHTKYQQEDYTEIDLAYWKQRLMNFEKELETALHVDIVPDNDSSPIYFFELKTMKGNTVIQSSLNPSATPLND